MEYDFSGWATRNNIRCSDGRTIMQNAFKDNDGQTVPLVWNHQHNGVDNVLGHALLENRDEGVYAYCSFNDTKAGQDAKTVVNHGDVVSLSIYANRLKQRGGDVIHGAIREVSLVLAGANPGAFIDSVIRHGEESDEEAVIYPDNTASKKAFENAGFQIVEEDEAYRPIKFYDVGAFVWFAHIIEWEFPNFSVDKCFENLLEMQKQINDKGSIEGTIHRYLIVARK